jgi:hypothetical protein
MNKPAQQRIIEDYLPPNMTDVVNFITKGDPTAAPPVQPLQYGQVLSPSQLSSLYIPIEDPAKTINTFLSDNTAHINAASTGEFNCLLYDNTMGLVDDYSKDPTICSRNVNSKCTLSAFSDKTVMGVTDNNAKSFADYNTYIGPSGLQLQQTMVSCGNRTNKLMWVYKDANSNSTNPDAIGVTIDQCPALSLNNNDLSTSTSTISALCNQPTSYVLVYDNISGAGYKCKELPPSSTNSPSSINPNKCINL